MMRKLAVPIAVEKSRRTRSDPLFKTRMLRLADDESEDNELLAKIAENRIRIDALAKGVDEGWGLIDSDDLAELDYLKASIQLGLLEITGELEATPCSDELFEEALA